jgi:hypothetical protein
MLLLIVILKSACLPQINQVLQKRTFKGRLELYRIPLPPMSLLNICTTLLTDALNFMFPPSALSFPESRAYVYSCPTS